MKKNEARPSKNLEASWRILGLTLNRIDDVQIRIVASTRDRAQPGVKLVRTPVADAGRDQESA